jgi:hypothetical protein
MCLPQRGDLSGRATNAAPLTRAKVDVQVFFWQEDCNHSCGIVPSFSDAQLETKHLIKKRNLEFGSVDRV